VSDKPQDRLSRARGFLRPSQWPQAQNFLRGYRRFKTNRLSVTTKPAKVWSRAEITIAASPTTVFSQLIDTDQMSAWLSDVEWVAKSSADTPEPGTAFAFVLTGAQVQSSFEWVEYELDKSLGWNGAPLPTGLGLLHPKGRFQLQTVYDATRLIATDEPELYGFARLLKPLLARSIKTTRSTDLARLKDLIEGQKHGQSPSAQNTG
jgi:hypothetical protein